MKILFLILLSMLHNFAVAEVTVEDEFSEFESETGSSESLVNFAGAMQIEEGRVISNKRLRFKLDRPFNNGGLFF